MGTTVAMAMATVTMAVAAEAMVVVAVTMAVVAAAMAVVVVAMAEGRDGEARCCQSYVVLATRPARGGCHSQAS
jgi:uncharacterized low-complexity protein